MQQRKIVLIGLWSDFFVFDAVVCFKLVMGVPWHAFPPEAFTLVQTVKLTRGRRLCAQARVTVPFPVLIPQRMERTM